MYKFVGCDLIKRFISKFWRKESTNKKEQRNLYGVIYV